MDEIRPKYAVFFGFNDDLRKIVESVFSDHRHPQNLREAYAVFSLGKAYKTHAAILVLCEKGYGEDGAVLSRTIFELAIYAPYICGDETGTNAQKFSDFDWVVRERKYNDGMKNEAMRKEFEKRVAADPKMKETLAEIVREATRVKTGYTKDELRRGWSGKTIRTIAEEVGRGDLYQTVYALQSELTHSAVTTANEYISESGENLSMDIAPSDNWVERTLVITFDAFLGVVEVWNTTFTLGLDQKLEELKNRYIEEMQKKQAAKVL